MQRDGKYVESKGADHSRTYINSNNLQLQKTTNSKTWRSVRWINWSKILNPYSSTCRKKNLY